MFDNAIKDINAAIAARTGEPITVEWDGGIVTREDRPHFDVFFDGDDTPFYVLEYPATLGLYESRGRHHRDEIDIVRSYDKLAERIVEAVLDFNKD